MLDLICLVFVPFRIIKRHFSQVFVPRVLIFRKLHLLLLSKMEVQAENGAKNHQLAHYQIFVNVLVVPFRALYY